MSFDLLGFGLGGAVGAALAVLAAGARLSASWGVLAETYKTYKSNRSNENGAALDDAFESHSDSVVGFIAAFDKLKRALRRR